jgi:hypothetical protein
MKQVLSTLSSNLKMEATYSAKSHSTFHALHGVIFQKIEFFIKHIKLTPWNRDGLEKFIVFQLSKKFSTFYGLGRFIAMSQEHIP